MKILIIEDEYKLLRTIEEYLLQEKYIVETASDYDTAYSKALIYDYDCVLLDITLPGGSGLKILEAMKNKDKADNVIIISAKDSIDDKIHGLDLGADDYITKPFHLQELIARIKAVFRRKSLDGNMRQTFGNTVLDFQNRSLLINDVNQKLNRKEFDMLSFFVINKNRIVTKETLAEHVWGDNIDMADNFDFVYSQVKNLRKKLKDCNSDIAIENIYAIGYKLIEK